MSRAIRTCNARKCGLENIAARWSLIPTWRAVAGMAVSMPAATASRSSPSRTYRMLTSTDRGRRSFGMRHGERVADTAMGRARHRQRETCATRIPGSGKQWSYPFGFPVVLHRTGPTHWGLRPECLTQFPEPVLSGIDSMPLAPLHQTWLPLKVTCGG